MEKFKNVLHSLGMTDVSNGVCTGIEWPDAQGEYLESVSPVDGSIIGKIKQATADDYEGVVVKAQSAFKVWRRVPAPKRGEIVRLMGDELRKHKEALATIVSYEMGKVYQEALGEIQEMIDICDFAVGQSRMLYGMTTHSERFEHRMFEQYHPLGIVGVISAFNFPVAVWSWNTMLALIAGDTVIWKPSSKTVLCAVAVHKIMEKVIRENNLPEGLINLVAGSSRHIGDNFLADKRIPLISATGSTNVGKRVGRIVGERLGKTILELGGNNAIIITENSDINMAVTSTVFGATGTTGQRCTSTRRLLVTENIYDEFKAKLLKVYGQITAKIGNPLEDKVLIGPLVDKGAVQDYMNAQRKVVEEGGNIIFGGEVLEGKGFESGCYVMPAIAEAENSYQIVQDETFAPLVYLIKCKDFEDAMEKHNDVPQGLSSAIFSNHIIETERFLSCAGSDCGIANVNIGTSGAEIGGAFGGEKETGGGRESGSDSWKIYMRRQTNTINYSEKVALAQGVVFDV